MQKIRLCLLSLAFFCILNLWHMHYDIIPISIAWSKKVNNGHYGLISAIKVLANCYSIMFLVHCIAKTNMPACLGLHRHSGILVLSYDELQYGTVRVYKYFYCKRHRKYMSLRELRDIYSDVCTRITVLLYIVTSKSGNPRPPQH